MRVPWRKSQADPNADPDPGNDAWPRQPVRTCFACRRARPPYVYLENGHDYCVACASESYALIGLRPAGRRQDDITLDELLRLSRGA